MAGKTNQKKKSHKKLWIILAIVAVVLVLLAILVIRGVQNMAKQFDSAMSGNTEVVERGELSLITEGSGVVKTVDSQTESLEYSVKLRKLFHQNGEQVQAGELIAEFDSLVMDDTVTAMENQLSEVESQLSNTSKSGSTSVKAPVSGRVKQIYASEHDSVLSVQKEQGALALLSADGRLKVVLETEAGLQEGQPVHILYGEETVEGIVQEMNGNNMTVDFADSDKYDVGVEVQVQTIDGGALGSGLTECGHAVLIKAQSGTIKSVSVGLNEKVSADSTLFKLEDVAYSQDYLTLLEQRDQLEKKLETVKEYKKGLRITADKDGILTNLTAKEGDVLAAQSVFCELLDTSAYQVVLDIDELDIQGISEGQQVEVTIDALEDKTFTGTVAGVAASGENTEGVGTYQVRVLLEAADELLPGMSANGKIAVNNEKDALLIPIDAIQTSDGEKSVTVVKDNGTTEKRQVKLGLVNNEKAQVLEGLTEGEKVQVIIKLEDIYSQMGITMESTEN